jgi:hypothetical protein
LKFINDQVVDVYAIIKGIHDILERHPFQPTNTTRMSVGIYGLIDDVVAVLPINELKTLFDKKMKTSKDFRTMVTAIHSPDFAVINICCSFSCQLLLMLCAFFCVNSCDECITPSHRIWWKLCKPGQNTRNCLRVYEERVLMWNASLNTLAHYLVSL